jgi:protein gp37
MLGPVDLSKWIDQIQWVIVGGESGVNSRPIAPNWVRYIRDQYAEADVPFFFKQWGNWAPSINESKTVSLELKASNGSCQSVHMRKMSKKEAGSSLDGRSWKQLPEA